MLVETSQSRSEGVYQESPLQKPIHYRTLVIGDKSTIDRGDGGSVDQSHVLPAPDNQTSENNSILRNNLGFFLIVSRPVQMPTQK